MFPIMGCAGVGILPWDFLGDNLLLIFVEVFDCYKPFFADLMLRLFFCARRTSTKFKFCLRIIMIKYCMYHFICYT